MNDFNKTGFVFCCDQMPKENQHIIIKYYLDGDERYTKGFYYTNGGVPCFCSYGSHMQNVTAWKPIIH